MPDLFEEVAQQLGYDTKDLDRKVLITIRDVLQIANNAWLAGRDAGWENACESVSDWYRPGGR